METEINPYAAPQSQVLQSSTHNELIRREHIGTEASVKSIGLLYYLAAFILAAAGVVFATNSPGVNGGSLLAVGFTLLLAAGAGATAYGLRRLQAWARIPTILLSSIALIYGLINLSGGIIIHIFILVKMLGRQARFIMTPEYQRIIAATPHVKYKTSLLLKVVLVLLLILLIGLFAASYLGR
jgi:hypothetical protein